MALCMMFFFQKCVCENCYVRSPQEFLHFQIFSLKNTTATTKFQNYNMVITKDNFVYLSQTINFVLFSSFCRQCIKLNHIDNMYTYIFVHVKVALTQNMQSQAYVWGEGGFQFREGSNTVHNQTQLHLFHELRRPFIAYCLL